METVAFVASSAVRRSNSFIVVHRLNNLRRSGRIGGVKAWLDTALVLKPLLGIEDGKLVLVQRLCTVFQITAAMIDRICEVIGEGPSALTVHHVANPAGASGTSAAPKSVRASDRDVFDHGADAVCQCRSCRGLRGAN
ncbi:DegV family protein [Mycobacterium leprae]|uniref:DegV family protein n=1 Tax=Mycobacterium leprae TaxID=1769 RepID=UPI001E45F9A8|nr:DegV family protein [Mycobacterium leprae]